MRLRIPAVAVACLLLAGCSDDDSGQNNNNNVNQNGVCGDGNLDTEEECDEGSMNSDTSPNACRTNCRLAWCGDQVVDASELCDNGPQNGVSPNPCRGNCTLNVCGDSYIGGAEICDDGNTVSGDGCRDDCMQDETLCGDGTLDPGEECDQGVLNSDSLPDACRTTCKAATCGDDVKDTNEACDGTDFGAQSCQDLGYAGAAGLVCAIGCLVDSSGCTAHCGNGETEPGEECDDGNTSSHDGCDDTCHIETDCIDNDGDGYGTGVDCLGPDCNDDDFACWQAGDACCQ